MPWKEFPLTQGVTLTRGSRAQEYGDLVAVEGGRYLPNDNVQIHGMKFPVELVSLAQIGRILQVESLGFERKAPLLLVASRIAGNVYLRTVQVDGSDLRVVSGYTAKPTPAPDGMLPLVPLVHRGDRYYTSTNEGIVELKSADPGVESLPFSMKTFEDTDLTAEWFWGGGLRHIDTMGAGVVTDYGSGDHESPFSFAATHVASTHEQYDDSIHRWNTLVVLVTEYDSVTDVESTVYHGLVVRGEDLNRLFDDEPTGLAGGYSTLTLTATNFVPQNANTTHLRVYVAMERTDDAFGNTQWRNAYIDTKNYYFAALVQPSNLQADVPVVSGETLTFYLNAQHFDVAQGVNQYSLVQVGEDIYDGQEPVPDFYEAAMFNDALVFFSKDEPQVLGYTRAKKIACSPGGYRLWKTTPHDDTGLRLVPFGSALYAFRRESVLKVNYLLFGSEVDFSGVDQLRLLEESSGLAARRCVEVLSLTTGDVLVWLDHQGLRMSDGDVVADACGDFSIDDAGIDRTKLDECFFVVDREEYRLRLFCPTTRRIPSLRRTIKRTSYIVWDFSFHRSHFKDTGFKLLGPTSVDHWVDGAQAVVAGGHRQWLVSADVLSQDNLQWGTSAIKIETAHIGPKDPLTRLLIDRVALTHTKAIPMPDVVGAPSPLSPIRVMARGQTPGEPEPHHASAGFVAPREEREVRALKVGGQAVWLEIKQSAQAIEEARWGPLELLMREVGGAGS